MRGNPAQDSKKASFAAFLFLPQFSRGLSGVTQILPIFAQTIAIMLHQADLLPGGHPALRGNYVHYPIRSLLAEAWYKLRSIPNPSPYQYGVYFSIWTMLALGPAILILMVLYAMGFVGSIAHAQIFSHPSGAASDSLTDVIAYPGGGPSGMMMLQQSSNIGDLALDLLNKTLRAGSIGSGGPFQNALAPLLGTYSTGVLVIAAIVVFWAILSIVVDTARTGQLGGGRHNMVWAPIRFVFALGLLVPIGGGFNSGQFIVLKLAEWGSNLGTNGWNTYVTETATQALLANTQPEDVTPEIKALLRMYVCGVGYNSFVPVFQGGGINCGSPRSNILIAGSGTFGVPHPECVYQWEYVVSRAPGGASYGEKRFLGLSNTLETGLCGSFELVEPFPAADPQGRDIDSRAANGDVIAEAKQEYSISKYDSYFTGAGDNALDNIERWAEEYIEKYNAAFTASASGSCGGDGFGGTQYPDHSCIETAINEANTSIGNIHTTAQTSMVNFLTQACGSVAGTPPTSTTNLFLNVGDNLLCTIRYQGWAGMGNWYHRIASLNHAFQSIFTGHVPFKPHNIDNKAEAEHAGTPGAASTRIYASTGAGPGIHSRMKEVIADFERVWADTVFRAPATSTLYQQGQLTFETEQGSILAGSGSSDVAGAMGIVQKIFTGDGDHFIFTVDTSGATYPLAELSKIGAIIVKSSLLAYGLMIAVPLATTQESGGGIISMLAGPFGSLMGIMGAAGFTAGALLLYYVPLLPWIRVLFAVVTWIVSVFEAVVMIPVVALAHLRTDGEGIMGPMTQGAYILYLNVLLRPILTVIGYVAALLVFNGMTAFVNDTMVTAVSNLDGASSGFDILDRVAHTIIYVGTIYVIANTTFKLVEAFPNATMKWIGGPQDQSFDNNALEGMLGAAAGFGVSSMAHLGGQFGNMKRRGGGGGEETGGKRT